jgi:hypothetical protein
MTVALRPKCAELLAPSFRPHHRSGHRPKEIVYEDSDVDTGGDVAGAELLTPSFRPHHCRDGDSPKAMPAPRVMSSSSKARARVRVRSRIILQS